MTGQSIIIIGAGAAGLMAAKELSAKGEKVIILEARDRLGGRVHTLIDPQFSSHIELGAEFIHGDLPVTMELLNEAGIAFHKTGGEMLQVRNGALEQEHDITDYWRLFEDWVKEVQQDLTINEFLNQYFGADKYASLRESVRGYAAGYDTADPADASTIALREEWLQEDDDGQFRPVGGYGQMVNYLAATCIKQGCTIHRENVVKQISWQQNAVSVTTADGHIYYGKKVIITLPVNVLKAGPDEEGAITCSPALPQIMNAVKNMGMGAIIKILFQFKAAFWLDKEIIKRIGGELPDIGFILSDEMIPTWWTQYPEQTPLLTGWLGGPDAKAHQHTSDEELFALAVGSLAVIFKVSREYLQQQLTAWKVVNWTADPYSRGSYSYATVETKEARAILETPVEDTIYFAGEALYDGPVMGTIEAALVSGRNVAARITGKR